MSEAFKSQPATISKADVVSNSDTEKTASLVNGIVRLTYFESILQDSIKASLVFSDAGNAIDGKSVVEGLPLVGTEDFRLEFEDNKEEKIKVDMIVNKVKPVYEDGSKNVISLELVSEEFIRNEMGENRCRTRENGLISDSIEKIFTDRLKSEKKLDIEQTKDTLVKGIQKYHEEVLTEPDEDEEVTKEQIVETQQLSEDIIEDVEENASEAGLSIDENS